ncbi:MAG: TerB family tellurite resistance protein [Bosea sp. (in: a-proteobacteria)]
MWNAMWGKLGGAGIGLAVGGPIGALIGAIAGHVIFDRDGGLLGAPDRSIVFTTGMVALSAKMARSDGVVTRDEVSAFRSLLDVPPTDLPRIEALFDLAKATTAGYEAYARQLSDLFSDEPALLEDILDGLFHVAAADGVLHEAEHDYLLAVSGIFGFSDKLFSQIEARHVRRADDPYRVLGVTRQMGLADIKTAWRSLVSEHHPDKALGRGLPPEAIAIATERLVAINAAWARISSEHADETSVVARKTAS